MNYQIEFLTEAKEDLQNMDRSVQIKILKKIHKLSENPKIGYPLGNKAGIDLSGYYKVYVDKKKIRIVYQIIEKLIIIKIIAIGRRSELKVYIEAAKRLES